jgi:hypothetical protein
VCFYRVRTHGTPRHAVICHPLPFVSHKAHIEVLAWHQPEDARSRTFVPDDVARDLLQRLAAEKISSKKIRMFSPDSVYMAGRQLSPEYDAILRSLPMPPAEIGCKFIPPPMQKNSTLPRINVDNVLIAAPNWDWTMEPATA